MGHPDQTTPPAGQAAVRWFPFLVFFHLLPVPWFMFVAAGLAPASFLFAAGVAGLFNTDFDSLPMAALFLAPALISGLVFVLLAYLLAAGIRRLKKPVVVTISLIIILAVCLGVALNPIYISGGHGSSYQFSLLGFLDILGQFRIPMAASVSHFICLTLLLVVLLVYQHTPRSFPTLPLSRERRRRFLRRSMVCGLIVFIAFFCWTHRALIFLKPLADMGVAGVQYRLALSLQKPGSQLGSNADSRHYLERAAEQGHIKAAIQGDAQIQYELGDIYLSGRNGIARDLETGRQWWDRALTQQHVKTMEMVAPAYQNGRFGYPVDLLKSKALVELLVEAYRDGDYGVARNAEKERYWTGHLKHFDRLFDMAGGSYLPLNDLRRQATAGDLQAQYRLVIYYENKIHIVRDNPSRGVALLQAAAEQNHLRAMGTLALAYEKGRYRLVKDYRQSQMWYQKLLQAYDSGQYMGEVDDRFISFQHRRLEYVTRARQ